MRTAWRSFLLIRLPLAALGMAVALAVLVGALVLLLVDERSINTWDGASLARKLARLQPENRPPEIIVLGGSANHYGIDSPLLEALTGYQVTNMATQYEKAFYFAEAALPFMRSGDVAVMPMEYPIYPFAAGLPPPLEYCLRISHDRASLDGPWDWVEAVTNCPSRLLLYGVLIGFADRLGFRPSFAYDSVAENEHGDVISNVRQGDGPAAVGTDFSAGMVTTLPIMLPRLEALADAVDARGAQFLLSFPPVRPPPTGGHTVDPAWQSALSDWAQAHGIELAGQPEDFVMPPDCFLDELHLRRGCAAEHTAHLEAELRPYLDTSH